MYVLSLKAAVWLLDKRTLEKLVTNKSDRDAAIELLKRGVSQLTRLRHPRILGVLHALEESRFAISINIVFVLCYCLFVRISFVLFLRNDRLCIRFLRER